MKFMQKSNYTLNFGLHLYYFSMGLENINSQIHQRFEIVSFADKCCDANGFVAFHRLIEIKSCILFKIVSYPILVMLAE